MAGYTSNSQWPAKFLEWLVCTGKKGSRPHFVWSIYKNCFKKTEQSSFNLFFIFYVLPLKKIINDMSQIGAYEKTKASSVMKKEQSSNLKYMDAGLNPGRYGQGPEGVCIYNFE